MAWPRRTGLPTAHLHARLLRAILLKYRELTATLLSAPELADLDALIECCDNFIQNVPSHEPIP